MDKKIEYISAKSGGRFGNQLYYLLQAYIRSLKTDTITKYVVPEIVDKTKRYKDVFRHLKMKDYVSYDRKNLKLTKEILERDSVYQEFGISFSESQLFSFIRDTAVTSERITKNDRDLAIHIRNGDYLSLKKLNFFDRRKFLDLAFQKTKDVSNKLYVYSDDNKKNRKEYGKFFSKNFENVIYVENQTFEKDFLDLCGFKNKIILNSTYAFWTAFISNVLFEDSFSNIIAPNAFVVLQGEKQKNRANPKWNLIDV